MIIDDASSKYSEPPLCVYDNANSEFTLEEENRFYIFIGITIINTYTVLDSYLIKYYYSYV